MMRLGIAPVAEKKMGGQKWPPAVTILVTKPGSGQPKLVLEPRNDLGPSTLFFGGAQAL